MRDEKRWSIQGMYALINQIVSFIVVFNFKKKTFEMSLDWKYLRKKNPKEKAKITFSRFQRENYRTGNNRLGYFERIRLTAF